MKLIFYKIGKIKILKPIKEISIEEVQQFNRAIDSIPETEKFVGFDFSELEHANSFVLNAISRLNNQLRKNKGRTIIFLNREIFHVFEISGFASIVDFVFDYSTFETKCKQFSEKL